ncbi:SDR family NAD(P)-dependent oxidoreductase [Agromyces bauzanensis]|uniref:SDR family NAD(P)-dependent oxidoreductase n=1 Tax=Agromyces bauzanensis TaxID=1308924 RepID=UPI001E4ECB52|nr:SDR family NAD(P)-dependent oxidoreductase [Agromyces bauzanensis]
MVTRIPGSPPVLPCNSEDDYTLSPLAIITGASSGVGRQTAIDLAEAGHDLVVVARDPDRLAETSPAARSRDTEAVVKVRPLDLVSCAGSSLE